MAARVAQLDTLTGGQEAAGAEGQARKESTRREGVTRLPPGSQDAAADASHRECDDNACSRLPSPCERERQRVREKEEWHSRIGLNVCQMHVCVCANS